MSSDESGTLAVLGVGGTEQEQVGRSRGAAATRGLLDRVRGVATQVAAPVWLWGFTHVGARAQAWGRPRVLNRGTIELDDDVVIDSRISPAEFVTAPGGRIVVGRGTVIEHGALLFAHRLVELGDRVTIGEHCILSDTDFDGDALGGSGVRVTPIWIGDDVVIGARVTILPGAIIGAGARIPPDSTVR